MARSVMMAAVALALLAAGSGPAAPTSAAPLAQISPSLTYRLADTWSNTPWSLTAGRYGEVGDISSAPDGTIFILDTRHKAVHVLEPDGRPRLVFRIPYQGVVADEWRPLRLDVGFDGSIYVLSRGPYQASATLPTRVDRLASDGRALASLDIETPTRSAYVDLAVREDGRIYLVRIGPQGPFILWPGPTPTPSPAGTPPEHGVDVFSPSGTRLAVISPPEMHIPFGVDVARDGKVYVLNRVPVPWADPGPDATPTPRPSWLASPAQTVTPVEGVMFFSPDHVYSHTVRFAGAEDIAVGPAGLFVSRQVEIFAVGESGPIYTAPLGRVVAAYFDAIVFHLDVPADGRLLAGINHCYFQGLLSFAEPATRPAVPALAGTNDHPELEGPPYPLRAAADEGVVVLEGRFTIDGQRPDQAYFSLPSPDEPQTVQRWTAGGQLTSQLGLCTGSESWWVRDVAVDGGAVWAVDADLLEHRPDDAFPDWSYWPAVTLPPDQEAHLAAVDADGGRAAVLDLGGQRVVVVDERGLLVTEWPLDATVNAVAVDLAMDGDRVYLADGGRNRIQVRGIDGTDLGEYPVSDSPVGLAVGPTGDLFVLGRGGWAFRYAPDGSLLAEWPMPDRAVDALDIAVDSGGRVYVPFIGRDRSFDPGFRRGSPTFRVSPAGVWVFEPVPLPPSPPPPVAGCLAHPDKTAAPARIPLGDEVAVRLEVVGQCPGSYDPVQVALVFDTSRSMNWNNALIRAKDVALVILGQLDPRAAEVALVTFDDSAALKSPLSRDLAGLRAQVASLEAWGDTRMATGLETARLELGGPRRNPAAQQVVLLITDGMAKDTPQPVADAILADGMALYALVLPTNEFDATSEDALIALTGDQERVMIDPDPGLLRALVATFINFRAEPGLFETLTIEDVVPDNMRYVAGSAQPAAQWDVVRRVLTWALADVAAADSTVLSYRLEPLACGTWPTNVSAEADFRDVLGQDGQLVFPVPEVEVYCLAHLIYLPYAARQACFPPAQPLDVVLLLDASSSMNEPAVGGGTKLEAASRAAGVFVKLLRLPLDRAAVVSFNVEARRLVGLTGDAGRLQSALAALTSTPGTQIDKGLAEATQVLADGARPGARRVVLLLSDGNQNGAVEPVLVAADALRATGARIYSVGLGSQIDRALLQAVAGAPERYLESPTTAELEDVFRAVSEQLACDRGGS